MNESKVESFHLIVSRSIAIFLLGVIVYYKVANIDIYWAIIPQIIAILLSFALIQRRYLLPERLPAFNKKQLFGILKNGFPLAINTIVWLIYFKIDVLMVGKMVGVSSAGLYEIAYKILEVTFVVPGVIMAIYFRHLAKASNLKDIKKNIYRPFILLAITGVVIAGLSQFILPIAFPLLFRTDQKEIIEIYSILAWSIPFVFIAHLTTQSLVILKKNKVYLMITLMGVGLNLLLNIILIPKFQMKGAAFATVFTEALILFLSGYFVLKNSKHDLLHQDKSIE